MNEAPAAAELFAGVADDYLRHRPSCPPALVAAIADRFALGPGRCVLDIGCGPAVSSPPLAATGAEVVGIDPSPDMIAAARARAGARPDIRFVEGTAEEVALDAPARLAVFGRAFHWVDRARVLARLEPIIDAEGGVVVCREVRPAETAAPWRAALAKLQRRWLPDGPRAHRRHAERAGGPPHEGVLATSCSMRSSRLDERVRIVALVATRA